MWTEEELKNKLKDNPELAKRNNMIVDNKPITIKKSKYNAKKVKIDGICFDSKKEGEYYQSLKMLKTQGIINGFCLQPRFVLLDGKEKIEYRADFVVFKSEETVIVDVKGIETPVFKLKKKLFKSQYFFLRMLCV